MTSRKRLLMIVCVAALALLAGCEDANSGSQGGEDLAADTGNNVTDVQLGLSYWAEVKTTEKNQQNLIQARPPFQMEDSLERQNLIRRYKYLNDQNNQHYVYLVSEGRVMAEYVAQGKVSSVNSKLTNDKQIVVSQRCIKTTYKEDEAGCFKTVESPQMDGSYGENGDAIFFFTAQGHYVESNLDYVVSEEPKNINTEVVLVDDVGDDDSGNETE